MLISGKHWEIDKIVAIYITGCIMELPNKKDIEASIHQAIQQAAKLVPDDMTRFQEDVEKNLKAALQSAFSNMDLVSREEFDIQSELLSRTRELLEELEKKISELEQAKEP
jgi:BMFP domain-containing protein YqiC